MSEISNYRARVRIVGVERYKSDIEAHPSFTLLQKAVGMTADELGGTAGAAIRDRDGKRTPCDLSIECPEFPTGVGIAIDRATGEVAWLYDPHGRDAAQARRIFDRIRRRYVALVMVQVLQQKGYSVSVEESADGRIVILSRVPHTARAVKVEVQDKGEIEMDYISFPGQSCAGTRDDVRRQLARFGVELDLLTREPKSERGDLGSRSGPTLEMR